MSMIVVLGKRDSSANNEEFYNPAIQTLLATINSMPHQLFDAGIQAIDIYPELKLVLLPRAF